MSTSRFTWESDDPLVRTTAHRARARLEAWGVKLREEKAAGLGSLPSSSGGGGRGKPGELPMVLFAALDVDAALQAFGAQRRLIALLRHIYVAGTDRGPRAVRFLLPQRENPWIELPAGAEPPVKWLTCVPIGERTIYRYNLRHFKDVYLDRMLERYLPAGSPQFWTLRESFLEERRSQFAAFMVRHCGLDRSPEQLIMELDKLGSEEIPK